MLGTSINIWSAILTYITIHMCSAPTKALPVMAAASMAFPMSRRSPCVVVMWFSPLKSLTIFPKLPSPCASLGVILFPIPACPGLHSFPVQCCYLFSIPVRWQGFSLGRAWDAGIISVEGSQTFCIPLFSEWAAASLGDLESQVVLAWSLALPLEWTVHLGWLLDVPLLPCCWLKPLGLAALAADGTIRD